MLTPVINTNLGSACQGDCLELAQCGSDWVDLIVTSPPYALLLKKAYGNVHADDYLEWFKPFAKVFYDALKPTGSLVINIGGTWNQGLPTRSLYHYKLLIMLVEEFGFHLAQDYFWWNPAAMPMPAEWVTVRRLRVKDAVQPIWWLSKTPWPKASNLRVLNEYSDAMKSMLGQKSTQTQRPSGHDNRPDIFTDRGGAIPPNLLAFAATDSNSAYFKYCKELGIKAHPARFPIDLPGYFIQMLTNRGDMVVDPFAGSCTTGEAAELMGREWLCVEQEGTYLKGAEGRFKVARRTGGVQTEFYKAHKPRLNFGGVEKALAEDGGKTRITSTLVPLPIEEVPISPFDAMKIP